MGATRSEQLATSPLYGSNADYIESLYTQYLADPSAVTPAWREYFAVMPRPAALEASHRAIQDAIAVRAQTARQVGVAASVSLEADTGAKQGAVSRLVQIYANRGHLVAKLDPLGLMQRERPRVLELAYFGLSAADLDTPFLTGSRVNNVPSRAPLREIIATLERVYCGSVGAEFAHVSNTEERLWLQDEFQAGRMHHVFTAEERKNILWELTAAEGLERYLHTKYVGQKRFSLEGGDSLIPLLDDLIQTAGAAGVEEFVIGMAHRGRLNVLVNVLGKAPAELFSEFEGKYDTAQIKGSGDVKYHKGFSADLRTPGGNVHVGLAFNPSHLEVVNPVVEGSVRARQERRNDARGERVVPCLIHGDAAFGGQGVVMETLQLSQARAYSTGGTVHLVVNNQVGFTTSRPEDMRSTMYCSDVAKMLEAPIFHVNGDDPEAVVFVARLAMRYRQRFHKDVVIDLVCYRRLGHNEADEPAATQPMMYQVIRKHPTTRKLYADRLVADGVLTPFEADAFVEQYRAGLDEGRPQAKASLGMVGNKYTVDWSPFMGGADWAAPVRTAVDAARLQVLGARLVAVPAAHVLHPRVQQVMSNRSKMLSGELPLDWGCAESMAYASLLADGYGVRISGQDSARGTFFHRHAVLHDQNTGATHVPLRHVMERQPRFEVIDSVLSEEAVLAFEYGYSQADPGVLVIWEAQFGDFANGAQVIIDQFISSGESKWGRYCGLTLFLPHGYEGQGPEHSSARLERFLQLCAEANMSVCVPSTPAQLFHMLRRQMLRDFRKPLVVMMPKSLLRHELSVSPLDELAQGSFHHILDEVDALDRDGVRRLVFSSGKVYFDLLKARRAAGQTDVALVRLEQIYPFPADEYAAVIARYPQAREIVWCQEEPQNQGAWYQIRHRLERPLGPERTLLYAGRVSAAAPATGIGKIHELEQAGLVNAALKSAPREHDTRITKRLAEVPAIPEEPARSAVGGARQR